MSTAKKTVSQKKGTQAKQAAPAPAPEEKVTTEEPTEAVAVEAAPEVDAPVEKPVAEEKPTPEVKIAEVVKSDPLGRQYLQEILNNYLSLMRPGMGVSEEQGAREQDRLATILVNNVYGSAPEEFGGNMKVLLDTVKENRKGAFNERYAYRFVAGMKTTSERRALFEDLLTLTLTTCDSGAKGAAKQIDVRKLIARIADERMVANLQSYYGVE